MEKSKHSTSTERKLRKPMTLEVGKTYRGSGIINEYGEVTFTPYQPSTADKNTLRKVASMSNEDTSWGVYKSDDVVCIRLTVKRADQATMMRQLRELFVYSTVKLEGYEI